MLLHQVDSKLRTVIELIQATILCVTVTKHINENELERVELDLKSLSGRRKTRQDVERTSALNVAKGNCLEVIRALQEGRQELENLKRDWSKLKDFYSRMEYFVAKATENSIAFIEVVRVIAKDLNVLDDEEIFVNLLEKIQKANEASFLVRGVSDMYASVSVKYIMDQIASQGDIMARIDNSQVEIEEIRNDLMSAHRIRDYIKADEISLRTRFVDRHNQIMDEYQWMLESWIVPAPRIESSAEEKSKFLSVSSNTKKKKQFCSELNRSIYTENKFGSASGLDFRSISGCRNSKDTASYGKIQRTKRRQKRCRGIKNNTSPGRSILKYVGFTRWTLLLQFHFYSFFATM
jgi:hypothetical protein